MSWCPVALLIEGHPGGMLPVMLGTPTGPTGPRLTAPRRGAGRDGTEWHGQTSEGTQASTPPPEPGKGYGRTMPAWLTWQPQSPGTG